MYLSHEEKVMILVRRWEDKFNGIGTLDHEEFHKECDDMGIDAWEVMSNIEDYYFI